MKNILFILLIIIYFTTNFLWADNQENTGAWVKVDWANDFVFQTDRYYTNGLNVEYFDVRLNRSFLHWFHLPVGRDDRVYYSLSLKQDIYTPVDKSSIERQSGDRPFASYLLLGSRRIDMNASKNLIIESQVQIGILGKYGAGEWIQNGIHELLPTSSYVVGWENQIKTDLVLNYGICIDKGLLQYKNMSLSGSMGGQFGTLHTDANAGINIRIGENDLYYYDLNFHRREGWEVYFYSDFTGRFIAYNASIQGGILNRDQKIFASAIEPFVFEINSGINISVNQIKLQLGVKSITSEIKHGLPHKWGYISFQFAL